MIITTGLFIALMVYLVVNKVWWFSILHFIWIVPLEFVIWIIFYMSIIFIFERFFKIR